jgi:hypothetical protein
MQIWYVWNWMSSNLIRIRLTITKTINLLVCYKLLPPSQNVRRLSSSQKSISSKFDQVYMKKYEYLKYQMDILRNYTFLWIYWYWFGILNVIILRINLVKLKYIDFWLKLRRLTFWDGGSPLGRVRKTMVHSMTNEMMICLIFAWLSSNQLGISFSI